MKMAKFINVDELEKKIVIQSKMMQVFLMTV